ncbi:MAG TPA: hypothetical protein VFR31_13870 [Thermoanaerobaculia bacterium]|nr:hypothetical protein [Thermoanaerobaculia bacterium]
MRIDVRRIVAILLLLLTLTPALSWAGQREPEVWVPSVKGWLLSTLWSFMTSVWEEEGGSLDPNGQPRPNSGSSLDPNGSSADEGGFIDPDG